MTSTFRIERLIRADEQVLAGLTDVLLDCVEGGASVSFMLPLPRSRAEAFWRGVLAQAESGERILLIASDDAGIVGTVQVVPAQPENQPHRADISKLLVHRRARRRGIAEALMREAETAALACDKTLLVLDTATPGDAERLYARLGWERCGTIPDYALWPDGRLAATALFYKRLGQRFMHLA